MHFQSNYFRNGKQIFGKSRVSLPFEGAIVAAEEGQNLLGGVGRETWEVFKLGLHFDFYVVNHCHSGEEDEDTK